MPLIVFLPLLTGATGFALGSWTSDLLNSIFKLLAAAIIGYLIYLGFMS